MRAVSVEEVRIKWVQANNKATNAYTMLRDMVCSGVEFAEEKIGAALAIRELSGEICKYMRLTVWE